MKCLVPDFSRAIKMIACSEAVITPFIPVRHLGWNFGKEGIKNI
jgi:hypothetical protein